MNDLTWLFDLFQSFFRQSFVLPLAFMALFWLLFVFLIHLFRGDF